jgi:hypothetical protein
MGLCGSVVGSETTLQAGRSRVGVPMRSANFLSLPNPSSRTIALGFTQPLTGMSTRNLRGSKAWSALKADNIAAMCEPTV